METVKQYRFKNKVEFMPHIKKAVLFVARMALASIAMSIAYLLSTTVIQVDVPMTVEEAQWAAQALFLVSTINARGLTYHDSAHFDLLEHSGLHEKNNSHFFELSTGQQHTHKAFGQV